MHHAHALSLFIIHFVSELGHLHFGRGYRVESDGERNAVDLYDQRDSKGQKSFISFKEGFPKDYLQLARGVLKQLPVKFPASSIAPSNEVWIIGDRIFALMLV